ncbi:hypothetical protein, partial [Hoeflea alexandrii]|uniref:hypothetical protein n=1 Tax=Hoeflea alexandrii TaxID=288436 RepID=UPI0022B079FB
PSLCERFIGGTHQKSQLHFFVNLSFFLTGRKKLGRASPESPENMGLGRIFNRISTDDRTLPVRRPASWRVFRVSPRLRNRPNDEELPRSVRGIDAERLGSERKALAASSQMVRQS